MKKFKIGDKVQKTKGACWTGTIVGEYSTGLTPEGYAVASAYEHDSVQIYPAAALQPWDGELHVVLRYGASFQCTSEHAVEQAYIMSVAEAALMRDEFNGTEVGSILAQYARGMLDAEQTVAALNEDMPPLPTAEELDALHARGEHLMRHAPRCAACGDEQVQLLSRAAPAQWKCRKCRRCWNWEPAPAA